MSTGWKPGIPAPTHDDLNTCVQCGLCLPSCPTFRITGLETSSPRGRIAAMRAVQAGEATVEGDFTRFTDECLACRACEAACPSSVPYGRLIEAARIQTEAARPAPDRLARKAGIAGVMGHRRMVRLMGLGMAITQALRLDRLLPRRLRLATPRVTLHGMRMPLPPTSGDGPTAMLLTGCVMDIAFRPVHQATIDALVRAGYTAVVPEGGGCCGALAAHAGELASARDLARRRIAELEQAEVIVVDSAGCSAHMRTYGHLLADDPAWAARAEAVAAKVRDAVEIDAPPGRPVEGRVAVHDACHHLHAQGIGPEVRRTLRAAGATCVDLGDGGRCCGAGGIYNVLEPALAGELGEQKARAIIATGAPVVAVANPGCAIQISNHLRALGSDVAVRHPLEIVD
ncbi:MAG: 4Fe-4S dicluster domain-containing protein [Acidobacteria bacterium]|nr:4Fe-4S dicluster domain-containing protein [Acidobacteriota bacterium]